MTKILEVKNLEKHFEVSKGIFSRNKTIVKAVDGISFHAINKWPLNNAFSLTNVIIIIWE